MLGTAGLPHILIRFYTVPTAKDARTSVLWAIGLIGAFYLMTLVLGFGAAALLDTGPESEVATSGGNLASPLLAEAVGGGAGTTGGAILLALIAAVAFATILAVVAGLTLTSASSVAHDLYANVFKKGEATEKEEVRVARIAAFVIGGVAIALGDPGAEAQHRLPGGAGVRGRGLGQPAVAPLQPVLAAVQHPRRDLGDLRRPDHLRRAGVLLAGGVRAPETALFTGSDWSWFPLSNPGIISIPAGLLFGWLGTITSREPEAEEAYDELEVRSLTGAGAEEAVAPLTGRPTGPAPTALSGEGRPVPLQGRFAA